MITILAVGVMLGGVVLTTGSWIRGDMRVLRDEVRTIQSGLSELRERVVRVEERVVGVESGLSDLRERVIRIESLLQKDSIGLQG